MSASVAVSLVGAGFGMLFGIPLLASRRFTTLADRLFGALVVVAALALVAIAAERSGLAADQRWLARVDFVLALAISPLLYLYVRALVCPGKGLRKPDLVHAVPALAAAGPFLAWSFGVTSWKLPFAPILAIQLVYAGLAAAAYWRGGLSDRSDVPAATRHLAGVLVALVALVHLGQALRLLPPPTRGQFHEVVPLLMTAGLLTLGGFGFVRALAHQAGPAGPHRARYRKSSLDGDTAREALARLDALMTTGKAFRDPALTLDGLAEKLSLPRHQLSQLLNQHLGTPLVDYLSHLRVEDAKTGLLDPANDAYTIEAVARDAGFASRSAFYAAFRQATGQTPTAYRRARGAG